MFLGYIICSPHLSPGKADLIDAIMDASVTTTNDAAALAFKNAVTLSYRDWAVFVARVDGLIASLPNGTALAGALVADWIARERERDVAEVGDRLASCPEDDRGYWEDEVRSVARGDGWERGRRAEDEWDKAVRALAYRDFFPGPDRPDWRPIHPDWPHYYDNYLTSAVICAPSYWPVYLNLLLEVLSKQLRPLADACRGSTAPSSTPSVDGQSWSACRIVERGAVGAPEWINGSGYRFTPNFATVDWFGTTYTFKSGQQAGAIGHLLCNHERGKFALTDAEIEKLLESENHKFRLDSLFRDHPAFGSMIQKAGTKSYRLNASPLANDAKHAPDTP